MERVQGGDLDPVAELLAALVEPIAVRLPRSARHQVEQPRPRCAVLAGGEVDHAGQLLRPASTIGDRELADVVPHVLIDAELIDAEALDAGEPGFIVGHDLQQRLDAGPHRVPGRPQLPGDSADGGVFAADLVDRPPTRPPRQQRPRRRNIGVLLGERLRRTRRLLAPPDPLAPHQLHGPVETRCIGQHDIAAAVATCDHPAGSAAHRGR